MRALEQRIVEGGEASISSASMVEMQQVLLHGTYRFTLKYFSLFFPLKNVIIISSAFVLLQAVTRLTTQCSEKDFELEVSFLSHIN